MDTQTTTLDMLAVTTSGRLETVKRELVKLLTQLRKHA